ncbi:MAG TPA: amino acid adenylation domain-containing protein [Reyranella sp.]
MSSGDITFPLSFAQRRLWFLDQLEPGTTFYNLPLVVPFDFAVNAGVLERGINEIVRRHEVLRTVFASLDDQPMQVIRPDMPVRLAIHDLRGLAPEEMEAETERLTAEIVQRVFDLAEGPLIRVALLRRGYEDHVFVLVMHHIVSDGWSLGIFWRELSALYNAYYVGQTSPLPEPPIQYADFAVWQRERLTGERLDRLAAYWRRQLQDLPLLQLPTDRPRPPTLSYRGASLAFSLPRTLSGALKALCQREGATLFMTLLSAFSVLLQRYSGQEDIVVGMPTASRDQEEIEGLIGFFVNSLVLRLDLSGNPSFLDLLQRVRETSLDAIAHHELPFEKLVEELQPERDPSRNPLFQVSFQLFSASPERDAQSSEVETIPVNRGAAVFDLAVNLWEGADEIGGQIEYTTDLFDTATIERLAAHYKTLLKNAVARPAARLSELQILSDAERNQLLSQGTGAPVPVPDLCVHQCFEHWARTTPAALAVSGPDTAHSYDALNRRANRIAHRLRGLGVTRGSVVAVCVERGASMVAAMLAILKTGAAYLPLDSAYPAQRLSFMLSDSGAKLVLSDAATVDRLPSDAPVLMLDDEATFAQSSEDDLPATATPDDPCYLIYTSGSTGVPKGVAVPHRGLANLSAWHVHAFAVTPRDRASQVASAAFDACGWEAWPYLSAGGSVHVIVDEVRGSPPKLIEALHDAGITIAFLPTPLAQAVLDDPAHAALRLRYLLTGGDKLSRPPPRGAAFVVVNNYGPTEYSVVATSCEVAAASATPPPIGRPIANTRALVLDPHLNLVPEGVVGELYIGGPGLALGYHNRPELTAERFVADPFVPGDRLYCTGDRVRCRADGQIEFLGRTDNQVKIRGFRIELGEIEAALTANSLVHDAVVVPAQHGGRLVAYVAPQPHAKGNGVNGSAWTELEVRLRAELRNRLPDYMVPSDFVILPALPLTAHGKIDRRALPVPHEISSSITPAAAPRTPLESVLTSMWSEVLDIEAVGVNDNFFERGGHSLLATQLVSRVREWLKAEVPLKTLFRAPTPALFAAELLTTAPDSAAVLRAAQLVVSVSQLSEDETREMLTRADDRRDEGSIT